MKLFILGASGLLGRELTKKASLLHDVFLTYNNNNNNLQISNNSKIKFCFPDDLENLEKILVTERPHVVINLIGKSNLDYCEQNKDIVFKLNVILTEKISNICKKINSKMIHISTDLVFDGKDGNYKENDETNPINYYGYTKQISEKKVLCNSNNVVIRTSLVYDLELKSSFPKFIFEKLCNGENIDAFDDVFTTPILVDELSEFILRIVNTDESGIFHISGNECISRFDFAKLFAKKLGFDEKLIVPCPAKLIEQNISRPQNSCLNNNKIKHTLGITFTSLAENLDKVSKNYFNNK